MLSRVTKVAAAEAPKAIGPYSQGVLLDPSCKLLFVSGQLPVDPKTGKMVEGDIRVKTHRAIDNLEAILRAGHSSLKHVLRVDIFLTDLKRDFAAMNEEYAKRFQGDPPPVRQTVQVAALPLDSVVEISCIAYQEE